MYDIIRNGNVLTLFNCETGHSRNLDFDTAEAAESMKQAMEMQLLIAKDIEEAIESRE